MSRFSSPWKTWLSFLSVLLLGVGACDGSRQKVTWSFVKEQLERVGVSDPPAKAPVLYDLLCDPSEASTCRPETLKATLAGVLKAAAEADSSRVRAWVLGRRVEETKLLAEEVVPTPSSRSPKARERQFSHWRAAAEQALGQALAPAFAASPIRRSPLAESIAKIALYEGHHMRRVIVMISDGREMASANFECGPLPSPERWVDLLQKAGYWQEHLLSNVTVAFAYLGSGTLTRCPASLGRNLQIEALWKAALGAANVAGIVTTSEVPEFHLGTTAGTPLQTKVGR